MGHSHGVSYQQSWWFPNCPPVSVLMFRPSEHLPLGNSHYYYYFFWPATCPFPHPHPPAPAFFLNHILYFNKYLCSVTQGAPTSRPHTGTSYQISGSIRLEMKSTINVTCLNHPETVPSPIHEKNSQNWSLVLKGLGTTGAMVLKLVTWWNHLGYS